MIDHFRHRIAHTKFAVKFSVDGDVDVFIDGGADDCARLILVKSWQIAPTTDKTDAQRGSADNHR